MHDKQKKENIPFYLNFPFFIITDEKSAFGSLTLVPD